MTWFEQKITSTATVEATRDAVWEALTDPDLLAKLTPFLKQITADGDTWVWTMSSVSILGKDLAPTFTEAMSFTEKTRIGFTHAPPEGEKEWAGVEGVYTLGDAGEGTTDLGIELGVSVDLPFPKATGPAVRKALEGVLAGMGRKFSANLLDHLGAREA
ncbi:hypothetical protein GCM10011519_31510 [Marmoricola endophyticus]|uniref:SRPBCC family protein n=1 Tax=Marmoricola endophyticus TaxID=2040280 RepID=A0A917F7C4_9ACTN|nr:SRPBCC family protein [Marmoricola endophyticus]GGF55305.1 hypothetical protein GCM10011519_31510 [Marmoricola endophyticus]